MLSAKASSIEYSNSPISTAVALASVEICACQGPKITVIWNLQIENVDEKVVS